MVALRRAVAVDADFGLGIVGELRMGWGFGIQKVVGVAKKLDVKKVVSKKVGRESSDFF